MTTDNLSKDQWDTLVLTHLAGDFPAGIHAHTRRAIKRFTKPGQTARIALNDDVREHLVATHPLLRSLQYLLRFGFALDGDHTISKANGVRLIGTTGVVVQMWLDGQMVIDLSQAVVPQSMATLCGSNPEWVCSYKEGSFTADFRSTLSGVSH